MAAAAPRHVMQLPLVDTQRAALKALGRFLTPPTLHANVSCLDPTSMTVMMDRLPPAAAAAAAEMCLKGQVHHYHPVLS
jgi:hypothetical protein